MIADALPLGQLSDIQKAADHAAMQSDRWLFLMMLIVFGLTIVVMVKWFMSQLDKRDEQIVKLHSELGHVRGEWTTYLIAAGRDLLATVNHNTEVIARNAEVMESLEKLLKKNT